MAGSRSSARFARARPRGGAGSRAGPCAAPLRPRSASIRVSIRASADIPVTTPLAVTTSQLRCCLKPAQAAVPSLAAAAAKAATPGPRRAAQAAKSRLAAG
jgi:hypothetical protein